MKHTEGPWKYHLGNGANPRFHIQTSGGYQIASTTELNKHRMAAEENAAREANARLIAAAPELLGALKEAQDAFKRYNIANIGSASIVANALAKAEGGAQ